MLILAFLPFDAFAQISIISDEETEQYLASVIRPLFQQAGVPFNRNKIYIVNDNSLNAFVGDGNNLFVHSGTLIKADSSDQISGVLAHETGHITGGHILRQKIKSQAMQEASLASVILAGAAAAASGRGDVAMAVMMGSQSSLLSNYMAYRVEEERSADEAAIKLLSKEQISPQGLMNFMKKFRNRICSTESKKATISEHIRLQVNGFVFCSKRPVNPPIRLRLNQTKHFNGSKQS